MLNVETMSETGQMLLNELENWRKQALYTNSILELEQFEFRMHINTSRIVELWFQKHLTDKEMDLLTTINTSIILICQTRKGED